MPAQASQDVTVTEATQHRAEDGGHHVCGAGGHWVHTTADIEGTWSRGHTAGQQSGEAVTAVTARGALPTGHIGLFLALPPLLPAATLHQPEQSGQASVRFSHLLAALLLTHPAELHQSQGPPRQTCQPLPQILPIRTHTLY